MRSAREIREDPLSPKSVGPTVELRQTLLTLRETIEQATREGQPTCNRSAPGRRKTLQVIL